MTSSAELSRATWTRSRASTSRTRRRCSRFAAAWCTTMPKRATWCRTCSSTPGRSCGAFALAALPGAANPDGGTRPVNDAPAHLSEEELQSLADGTLAPEGVSAARVHLAACPACAGDVARIESLMKRTRESAAPTTDVNAL